MNNIAPITSARLSHDGNCILVSTLDDTVRLMDKAHGTLLNEYAFLYFYFENTLYYFIF